jgi:TPR repeat protein
MSCPTEHRPAGTRRHRLLVALALAALLAGCATSPPTAPLSLAPTGAPRAPDPAGYRQLRDALLEDRREGTAEDWSALVAAWSRVPDLTDRLAVLAVDRTERGPLGNDRARARLDAFAGDLAAHRALAEAPDDVHDRAARALVAGAEASGDGSEDAPWSVRTAQDAVALLDARGVETVGGYYVTPTDADLGLVLAGRDGRWAREYHFDLGGTLAAVRAARAWFDPTRRVPATELLDDLAAARDGFARTTLALRTLAGPSSDAEYAAARRLQPVAEAGNVVAVNTLADLYRRLADPERGRREDVRAAARASARAGYAAAAARGSARAVYQQGLMALADGDEAAARERLETAHEAGERLATRRLVELLRADDAGAARANALIARLAERGDPEGRFLLARWLLVDEAVDDPIALDALQRNVEAGHADSMALMGDLFARGTVVERDLPRAVSLWTRAARRSDDADLAHAVARVLLENDHPEVHDPAKAAAVLEHALRGPEAAARCAACYATLAEAQLILGDDAAAAGTVVRGLTRLEAEAAADLRAVVYGDEAPEDARSALRYGAG